MSAMSLTDRLDDGAASPLVGEHTRMIEWENPAVAGA
jgi:hypothetical protein